jgi:tRNA-specific adenosine deaminase 1
MKSLPRDKLPSAEGNVLHDSHAEVLAIRAFNSFLTNECSRITSDSNAISLYIRRRTRAEISEAEPQQFEIREEVRIHMYCSDVPCGDASMELIMENQIDATPWSESSRASVNDGELMGRGHFDQLGIVRRKPGELLL